MHIASDNQLLIIYLVDLNISEKSRKKVFFCDISVFSHHLNDEYKFYSLVSAMNLGSFAVDALLLQITASENLSNDFLLTTAIGPAVGNASLTFDREVIAPEQTYSLNGREDTRFKRRRAAKSFRKRLLTKRYK